MIVRTMLKNAANCHCFSLCDYPLIRLALAAVVGFVLSVAPLWPQAPPKPTFNEIAQQAAEARAANRVDQAIALYREGLKLKPTWKEGSWYLGTSLYGLKRYGEARQAFRHLASLQPGNGRAWALAGMCEFELKHYERALQDLLRSEQAGFGANPGDNSGESDELAALVRFRIALLLNRAGEFEQALGRLIPIAAVGSYPEVTEAMGLTLLRAPLLPSEVPERDRDLYMKAGEAMAAYVAHNAGNASRLFDELVTEYPDRPNLHYARGTFLLESAPDKALLEFQRELELNPSNPLALTQVAKLYLEQGAPDKALPYARNAVKQDPKASAPHKLLGEALLDAGELTAAIQELQVGARLDPKFPQTHFLLAQAYRRAGNKALASKEMAEFQHLDDQQKSEFRNADTPK